MSIKSDIRALRRALLPEDGACVECGHYPGKISHIEVRDCSQQSEPVAFLVELPQGFGFYPPDPRPTCATCGQYIGTIITQAVYEQEDAYVQQYRRERWPQLFAEGPPPGQQAEQRRE